jgi:hypothetical protein
MIVAPKFPGDTDVYVMEMQRRIYGESIGLLAREVISHYIFASVVVSGGQELGERLKLVRQRGVDHRILQPVHDKIAAHFRQAYAGELQPALPLDGQTHEAARIENDWMNFWASAVKSICEDAGILRTAAQCIATTGGLNNAKLEDDLLILVSARFSFHHSNQMSPDPIRNFTNLILEATRNIDELYMRLPRDGHSTVHRERVYCYELYHQLRTAWNTNPLSSTTLVLNGEVDKLGQSQFEIAGLRGIKPDLLLHGPGSMDENHTVVEVKSASYQRFGLLKDLSTLHKLNKMTQGYKRQILLVFGSTNQPKLIQDIDQMRAKHGFDSPLELWCHAQARACANCVKSWQ